MRVGRLASNGRALTTTESVKEELKTVLTETKTYREFISKVASGKDVHLMSRRDNTRSRNCKIVMKIARMKP